MPTPKPGIPVRGSTTGRPIMALFDLLGRRWTMRILWELSQRPCTFRELQQQCEQMSSSVLNTRLGELRDSGLLAQHELGYSLSPSGQTLMQLIAPLRTWADQWQASLPDTPTT
ncbi:winged helix-turn-helix transcriptional regulator [Leeia sp.]|uniref:winged helix-turn-helix transcriptional regulator n=1 Tax=Leeia sp. TaxID=2884678 RepID=UPI0035AF0BB4